VKPDVNSVGFHPHLSHNESIPIAMVTLGLKHSLVALSFLPARKGDAESPHNVNFFGENHEQTRTQKPKCCRHRFFFPLSFSGYDNRELTKKF
jgi:hypothetical protein